MKTNQPEGELNRRDFVRILAAGGIATAASRLLPHPAFAQQALPPSKPATNAQDALKIPRSVASMPGKFPGKVVESTSERAVSNAAPDTKILSDMVGQSLIALTGASTVQKAWREFITPEDIVGLKVNPVAGKLLSTSPEIVQVIIEQLVDAGIPREKIVIWDRREFELHDVGFTAERFPGIRIVGTEQKDSAGSFYDAHGKVYGERMIDKDWYYWADVEEKYDAEILPYMVNEGKFSYFTRICTKDVTKIINIPILKNAGPTVTLCLKNLAFGAVSNTSRLHKQLWAETCAEVPAFAPLRDKVVLNIVDGIKGCYNGGPAANPDFISYFNTVLVGSDPVAVDRVGYDIVLKKRLKMKVQKEESPRGRTFLDLAEKLQLGVADLQKIERETISI